MQEILKHIKSLKNEVDFSNLDEVDEYYYEELLPLKNQLNKEIDELLEVFTEVKITSGERSVNILHKSITGSGSPKMFANIKRKRLGKILDSKYMPEVENKNSSKKSLEEVKEELEELQAKLEE